MTLQVLLRGGGERYEAIQQACVSCQRIAEEQKQRAISQSHVYQLVGIGILRCTSNLGMIERAPMYLLHLRGLALRTDFDEVSDSRQLFDFLLV
jgi:hypothetical protein